MKRRQALRQIAVASAVVGLAGCTEEAGDDSDSGDDTGEDETSGTGGSDTTDTGEGDSSDIWGDDASNTGDSTSLEDEYPNAWAIDEELEIVVLSADAVVERYGSEITGELVNAGETNYDYVQLSFDLLDDDNTKIADALANTSGLQAGQRWRYKAVGGSSSDITTFRLVDVTAY